MAIKVTTRETPELHAFRARYARLTRKLPKKYQAAMFAHIIMTDCRTHERYYAKTVMVAYSAKIAPKYKLPAATMADIKRYNPELDRLGYIKRETLHMSDWDSNGKLKHKQINRYVINVEALEMLAQPADTSQSEPITAPITAPTIAPITAPYIVGKPTESRFTESRLKTEESASPHHQVRDDDRRSPSTPSGNTGDQAEDSARAQDEALLPGDRPGFEPYTAETLTRDINKALEWAGIPLPAPFSFGRLGAADRARVPELIIRLDYEMDFTAYDLIDGLILEGRHNPATIWDGAKWLGSVLRGVGEAELREWAARGREHLDAQDRAEREEEQARADRQAAEERAEAEAARLLEESRSYRKSLEIPYPDGFDPETGEGHERYTGPAWWTGRCWTLGVPNLGWCRIEVTGGRSDVRRRLDLGTLGDTEIVYPPADAGSLAEAA